MKKRIEYKNEKVGFLECTECNKWQHNYNWKIKLITTEKELYYNSKPKVSIDIEKFYICPNCGKDFKYIYKPNNTKLKWSLY